MTRTYEDPDEIQSEYTSMKSGVPIYKAAQIRSRTSYSNYKRSKSNLSTASRSKRSSVEVYFAFITILLGVNIACTCYLIVSVEMKYQDLVGRIQSFDFKSNREPHSVTSQIESKINTIMSSLSYHLPQVLHTTSNTVINRLSHMGHDLKSLIKNNFLELDVKLGNNRSFSLNTGSRRRGDDHEKTYDDVGKLPMPTLIPVMTERVNNPSFYPLKGHQSHSDMLKSQDLDRQIEETRLQAKHTENWLKAIKGLSYSPMSRYIGIGTALGGIRKKDD